MSTADSTHNCRASIRLTPAEREQLDRIAWARRVPVSALIRHGIARVIADPDSAPRRTRPARARSQVDEDR